MSPEDPLLSLTQGVSPSEEFPLGQSQVKSRRQSPKPRNPDPLEDFWEKGRTVERGRVRIDRWNEVQKGPCTRRTRGVGDEFQFGRENEDGSFRFRPMIPRPLPRTSSRAPPGEPSVEDRGLGSSQILVECSSHLLLHKISSFPLGSSFDREGRRRRYGFRKSPSSKTLGRSSPESGLTR